MEPRVAYGGDIDGGAALEGVADHGVAAVVLGDARVQRADLRALVRGRVGVRLGVGVWVWGSGGVGFGVGFGED